METIHIRPTILVLALGVAALATVALIMTGTASPSATALATTETATGQPRLLIGALAGLALLVLANFAIDEEREDYR